MLNTKFTQHLLQRYLVRYPVPLRLQRYDALARWSWLQPSLEQIKPVILPADGRDRSTPPTDPIALTIAPPGLVAFPSYYQQYRCIAGNPLNCAQAQRSVEADPQATACSLCGFLSPLPVGSLVIGEQGTYRIEQSLGQRGISRGYRATLSVLDIPITLREYVLPERYFTPSDRRQRQDIFLNQVGLALADGRSQDLRIVVPIEAIAPVGEDRAYLLLPIEDQCPTLNDLLRLRGPFTAAEVYQMLRQVLQTLVGLHQQRYALSPGHIQTGIVHGNIQLSSLLWVEQGAEWFIYLTDFARWEESFNPLVMTVPEHAPQEDLAALGAVAFELLTSNLVDASGQTLNPRVARHWPGVDPLFKAFIQRLLGLTLPFATAQEAYQALLQLPPKPVISALAPPNVVAVPPRRRWWLRILLLLLGLGAVVLVSRLLWVLLRPQPVGETPPLCCFEAVGAVPEGAFTYTALTGDVWGQVLNAPGPEATLPLMEQMAVDQPNLQLTYLASGSVEAALENVRSRQADFALLPLLQPLPIDMAAETVAYDGLAVVVAFSYQGRSQGLPDQLQGQLSLANVRDLYQGEITTWHQVKPALSQPIKLYVNPSPTTQAAIQHLIEPSDEPSRVAPMSLDTLRMMRRIIRDFETAGIGSIGITPLSSIVGQCSVYPLAIAGAAPEASQPFRRADGQTLKPSIDLCNTKGVYQINPEVLHTSTYPLAYPLAVVYRRDNRLPPIGAKFAALLLTDEGQIYLQQANLTTVTHLELIQSTP
ncbi:substrate-binding domain-containing protein [Nodosilinea sp. E11]|uniref:substrate-binding domain-containing protein n=1 Tax=Nodosilinea sp. E11 TaxID=3037479 RepID=UPI002935245F|nr:substrate-binding domain-containing protein [Nodosilinea sp. E11]WOD37099.1 substrate-binding domain-containing protein [Nodosilinea sp. E11]